MEFKKFNANEDYYPPDWPPKDYYVRQGDVTRTQLENFKDLVNSNAQESEIDQFLQKNLPVLVCCLSFLQTGHHGAWIIPQQVIRPPRGSVEPGLKPDYLLGGKSSDGFTWSVLDLKGANESIFANSGDRLYFSNTVTKGIFQLLEYIDYCSEMQTYMRDGLKLTGFREPQGLLIIGREEELTQDSRRARLRGAWNRATYGNLEVRTYDALLRTVDNIVTSREKYVKGENQS